MCIQRGSGTSRCPYQVPAFVGPSPASVSPSVAWLPSSAAELPSFSWWPCYRSSWTSLVDDDTDTNGGDGSKQVIFGDIIHRVCVVSTVSNESPVVPLLMVPLHGRAIWKCTDDFLIRTIFPGDYSFQFGPTLYYQLVCLCVSHALTVLLNQYPGYSTNCWFKNAVPQILYIILFIEWSKNSRMDLMSLSRGALVPAKYPHYGIKYVSQIWNYNIMIYYFNINIIYIQYSKFS